MTEINLFNRWQVKRKTFWLSIGGLAVFSLCGIFALVTFFANRGMGYGGVDYALAPAAMEQGMYIEAEEAMAMEAPAMDKMADDEFYRAEQSTANTSPMATIDRLIIRNGDINVEVNDTRQAHDDIEDMVLAMREQGAFVLSSTEHGGDTEDNPYISMVIRVPAESFDNVMDMIADMAMVVNSRNESADDVTEEYYDLGNRLESMEAARLRLLEIMENADTTEDLLVAEQQLTQRETEIESIKGRMQYLSESAKLSRITISLQPYHLSQPIDTRWKPLETIREAIDDLIDGFQGFIEFLLYFVIAVLPWLALFGLIIWLAVKFFRGRKAKKEANSNKE